MALAYDSATQFVAVALKRSRIDGYGVFAAEDIPAGTRLGLLTGESITVAEARRRAQESRRLMLVELSPARAIDALNLLDALKRFPQADASRIGVWGHSNGAASPSG